MARPADPHARDALISAARKEFVRHGIVGARIEDITQACKLSKGAFYLHFESKEALFKELVDELASSIDAGLDARFRDYAAFAEEHGPLTRRNARTHPARIKAMEELDLRHDLATLEAMWERREVLQVLLHGSQGTAFEHAMWGIVDREIARVVETTEQMKTLGLCRHGLPSEVVGSMVIGTWLLLVRQMADMKERPDLEFWVRSLKELITLGVAPRDAPGAVVVPNKRSARSVS
jgi:AcrR family transcriptional regulator